MNYYILSDWPVFWSTTFSPNIVKWTFEYNSIRNMRAFKIKKCWSHNKLSFTNRSFPFYLIMAVESFNYDCAVRGYHVYKSVWEPKERQVLSSSHEENDTCDIFAIKTCLTDETGKEKIVGHLPLELSRFTKYLLDRGAVVSAQLTSTHYERSVMVQGGLKIPCLVKVKMIATEKNKRILYHFLDLVNKNYKDLLPKKEITVGSFFASKTAKNPRQVTLSIFRSSNELLQERKRNLLIKIRMQTLENGSRKRRLLHW